MKRPPFHLLRWSIISTANVTVAATIFAVVGWWWLVPVYVVMLGFAWYFASCSCWFAGQAKVLRRDYS